MGVQPLKPYIKHMKIGISFREQLHLHVTDFSGDIGLTLAFGLWPIFYSLYAIES